MALKKFVDPEIGMRLKRIREGRGLTQEAFGAKLKHSQGAVDQWENGRVPHAIILRDIARLAGVSTDYLLGLDQQPCPHAKLISGLERLLQEFNHAQGNSNRQP